MFTNLPPTARAVLMFVLAIFLLSTMDMTAKALSQNVGVMPVVWARYMGQSLVVVALVGPRLRLVARTKMPRLHFVRSLFLFVATACFFTGLSQIGLAEATAIMNVNPVLITLGAALFLGEPLGRRRVFGILAAMIGALIIIRPGASVFSPYALLTLTAALGYSGYMLLTRHVGKTEDPWTSLLYTALFGGIVSSFAVPFFWVPPSAMDWLLMAAIAGLGTVSQLFMIKALSQGEAGMLAPFAYSGLIFAAIYGMVIFAEWPDLWTIIGALVIVSAGIYVWHRETRATRQ